MSAGPTATSEPGAQAAEARRGAVVWLFSATLFLSAALVFVVQPMFGKFVLPLYGSTPAVWTTSLLFFQVALLAAYLYVHVGTARLPVPWQIALHVAVLLVVLPALPVAVPDDAGPAPGEAPVPQLLALLAAGVGLPFFVVASTAPLVQRWLAGTRHPAAGDPYFLYRASNLGSVLGLLAYPVVVEPALDLGAQGEAWSLAYVVLALLLLGCAFVVGRLGPRTSPAAAGAAAAAPTPAGPAPAAPAEGATGAPATARRLGWLGLAFVPSTLMLGFTTYFTTDIAPVPLFWVVPLALYLLSFSIVFSPGPRARTAERWSFALLPPLGLATALLIVLEVRQPILFVLPVHLAGFFVACMVCHGRLAQDRPAATHLTGFYLVVAVGGALGGVFAAVLAPAVFDSLLEYPLAVVLACLCLPRRSPPNRWDAILPVGVAALTATLLALVSLGGDFLSFDDGTRVAERSLALGYPVGLVLALRPWPLRFGLSVAALVLVALLPIGAPESTLFQDRSFFGVSRVTASEDGSKHTLVHGTTVHGVQSRTEGRRLEPASYYVPGGSIAQLVTGLPAETRRRAGIVGLGTGTLACYAGARARWTFYEIDPTVVRIARDPRLFSFLRDCPGRFDVVLGDARLSLTRAPAGGYGLIVVDAFTSDAIPMHLLTREALALYRSRLRPGGVLSLHISNKYLELEPVVGRLARDAGLVCIGRRDRTAHWLGLARARADLGAAGRDGRWAPCAVDGGAVWTDDHSNLLSAVRLGLDR